VGLSEYPEKIMFRAPKGFKELMEDAAVIKGLRPSSFMRSVLDRAARKAIAQQRKRDVFEAQQKRREMIR
jgi:uncharacterized protein (DUF1778 family)